MLAAHNISVAFGGVHALRDVTLTLNRGEILALIGPNGAGKSTLVDVLTGFRKFQTGYMEVDGESLLGTFDPPRAASSGIYRTFQHARAFPTLTVAQNLTVGQKTIARKFQSDRTTELLRQSKLTHIMDKPAVHLTVGQQQTLAVVRSLIREPKYLILDEPAGGLNNAERSDLLRLLEQARGENIAVLLIEHNMEFIKAAADRIHVIDRGETLLEGRPDYVLRSSELKRAYLGN